MTRKASVPQTEPMKNIKRGNHVDNPSLVTTIPGSLGSQPSHGISPVTSILGFLGSQLGHRVNVIKHESTFDQKENIPPLLTILCMENTYVP